MNVRDQTCARPGEGFLGALGYLQVGTGALSLTMSLMVFFQALFSHPEVLNPALALDTHSAPLDRAIATYVSLQLTVGWIAGVLQILAGRCCLHGRRLRFVALASWVSVINFPHGSIAALVVLMCLRRPDIAQAFERNVDPRLA